MFLSTLRFFMLLFCLWAHVASVFMLSTCGDIKKPYPHPLASQEQYHLTGFCTILAWAFESRLKYLFKCKALRDRMLQTGEKSGNTITGGNIRGTCFALGERKKKNRERHVFKCLKNFHLKKESDLFLFMAKPQYEPIVKAVPLVVFYSTLRKNLLAV